MALPACSLAAPAPPTVYSVSGRVTEAGTTAAISGATITILIRADRKTVATTDAEGNYSFSVFSPAGDALIAWAPYHYEQMKVVDLTTARTLSFELVGGAPGGPWDY